MPGLSCTCHWPSCSSNQHTSTSLGLRHTIATTTSYRTALSRSFQVPKELGLAGAQLLRGRQSAARAAARPEYLSELQDLVSRKLDVSSSAAEQLLSERCLQSAVQQQALTDAHWPEVEAGLDRMLQLFSSSEVLHLLEQQPAVLTSPLASWLDFFAEYGFTCSQTKNLISQTPEVLVRGSLVTAGEAIMHLKHLGFDNDEVRHRVVAYCPQVLMMEKADIDTLITLWSKFQVGVDERAGM